MQTNHTILHKYVSHDKQRPCHEIAAQISQERGITVSTSVVYRCLKSLDYSKPYPIRVPMLSEKNRLIRLEWANKNKGK